MLVSLSHGCRGGVGTVGQCPTVSVGGWGLGQLAQVRDMDGYGTVIVRRRGSGTTRQLAAADMADVAVH